MQRNVHRPRPIAGGACFVAVAARCWQRSPTPCCRGVALRCASTAGFPARRSASCGSSSRHLCPAAAAIASEWVIVRIVRTTNSMECMCRLVLSRLARCHNHLRRATPYKGSQPCAGQGAVRQRRRRLRGVSRVRSIYHRVTLRRSLPRSAAAKQREGSAAHAEIDTATSVDDVPVLCRSGHSALPRLSQHTVLCARPAA